MSGEKPLKPGCTILSRVITRRRASAWRNAGWMSSPPSHWPEALLCRPRSPPRRLPRGSSSSPGSRVSRRVLHCRAASTRRCARCAASSAGPSWPRWYCWTPQCILKLGRVRTTLPRLLSVSEVARLLDAPDVMRPWGLRDRAVMETLYATGMRRAECYSLNLQDVDFSGLTIHVHRGKGGRARKLPLGATLANTLQRYLRAGRPPLASASGRAAFFVGQNGERFSMQRYNQILRQYAQAAELGRVTPHSLRHAFAVHMVEGGADIRVIRSCSDTPTLAQPSFTLASAQSSSSACTDARARGRDLAFFLN